MSARQAPPPPPDTRETITILIIDDQEQAHILIALALRHITLDQVRVELRHAYNRRQALRMLREERAIHLALLDAKMPGGPGGDGLWLIPDLVERGILVVPYTVNPAMAALIAGLVDTPPLAKWATPEEIGAHLTDAIRRRMAAVPTPPKSPFLEFLAQERGVAPEVGAEGLHPSEIVLNRSELGLLLLEADSATPAAMAGQLGLSLSTIYQYRSRLTGALGLPDSAALRRWARAHYPTLEAQLHRLRER